MTTTPSLAAQLTLAQLAAGAEEALAALEAALAKQVEETREVASTKNMIALFEADATLDARIDGKNAEAREAQRLLLLHKNEAWCNEHQCLDRAEDALRTAQNAAEVARERLKLYRALIEAQRGGAE